MNTLLYIDPGTGSMLFSILIGACATIFFLAKALIIKIKVLLTGGRATLQDKSYKPYVIYCEDKRYWTVFLPIVEEFEKRKIDITYYSSDKNDPVFTQKLQYTHPEFIGVGNTAYAKLNLLSAGIVIMSTPSLDVYQLKRSKFVGHYCHIFHSTSDATTYRLFGLDYFDSVLLTGDYQAKNIRFLEKKRGLPAKDLVTVGCTYLDVARKRLLALPEKDKSKFTVLVSPSWGPSGLLSLYGTKLLDPLVKTGFNIILRPHPQSYISEKPMLDAILERYKDASNVCVDRNADNITSLWKADLMISDFSGIIYDYLFLCDRPVMYAASEMSLDIYDAWYIPQKLWQFRVVEECGIKIEEKDFSRIKDVILAASDSQELEDARHKAKAEGWQYIGEAGKRAADYMMSVVEKLNKQKQEEQEQKAS